MSDIDFSSSIQKKKKVFFDSYVRTNKLYTSGIIFCLFLCFLSFLLIIVFNQKSIILLLTAHQYVSHHTKTLLKVRCQTDLTVRPDSNLSVSCSKLDRVTQSNNNRGQTVN